MRYVGWVEQKKTRSSRAFFCETHQHLGYGLTMGFGKTRKERTRFSSTHPTNNAVTPSGPASQILCPTCVRNVPHLGAVFVENQRKVCGRRDPASARDLAFEL